MHQPPTRSLRTQALATRRNRIAALTLVAIGLAAALVYQRVSLAARPPTAPIASGAQPTVALRAALHGLDEPLFVTHAGDGSGDLYIVEKAGRIRVARDGAVRPEPFLDITDLVNSASSERGLLGLVFHPSYPVNGYFYVNYTNRDGNTVVARYEASQDRTSAAPRSATTVLAFDQPFPNHNGGHLAFGPDGRLWIATGDGGAGGDPFGNAQDRSTLLGKMLRIDVDRGVPYAIPTDNAYPNDPTARPEIWALGLRNPWRYSFDRATGDLYIGDVGQSAIEEVSFTPSGSAAGLNYGWNRMEGTRCYPIGAVCDPTGLVQPFVEYATGRDGCAVTGGYVYRGPAQPALVGTYFYSDYCSGTIWGAARDTDGEWRHWIARPAPGGLAGYSSFGEDEAGELYITVLDAGTVYRLVVAP